MGGGRLKGRKQWIWRETGGGVPSGGLGSGGHVMGYLDGPQTGSGWVLGPRLVGRR